MQPFGFSKQPVQADDLQSVILSLLLKSRPLLGADVRNAIAERERGQFQHCVSEARGELALTFPVPALVEFLADGKFHRYRLSYF